MADFSPAARAVASLVLPSTTRVDADGSTGFDPAVVQSAAVTGTDPFVVQYTLNQDAAWSDGTPVTAEDFVFLWNQMLVQPGTVDPAGYRMISAIRSLDAGKVVDVQFTGTFGDWPSLFSPLLPSHILKDAPGGWLDGLDGGIPVSANQYKMASYDTVTGEITLVRNDKYWADTTGPDELVLRIDAPDDLLAALQRGDIQALWVRPGDAVAQQIEATVPEDRRSTVALPATVQLVLNMTAGATAERSVRTAVATALDYPALRAVLAGAVPAGGAGGPGGSGGDSGDFNGMLPVASQVRLPAQTGTSTGPPLAITGDPDAAREVLSGAGFDVGGVYARRDGQVLSLTLAVPSQDARLLAAARLIQRQLGAAGIAVDVLVDAVGPLIAGPVATGTVDLTLLTVPRSRSDAVAAASAFGCPDESATPATLRTGNLSGYCAVDVQALLDAVMSDDDSAFSESVDLAAIDDRLWSDLPVIPIGEPVGFLAVGPAHGRTDRLHRRRRRLAVVRAAAVRDRGTRLIGFLTRPRARRVQAIRGRPDVDDDLSGQLGDLTAISRRLR